MDIYHLGVLEQFKCLTISKSDIKKSQTQILVLLRLPWTQAAVRLGFTRAPYG